MRGEMKASEGGDALAANPAAEAAQWVVAVAQRGDRVAFACLFDFYAPRLKSMLMRMGVSGEIAEDIAQDTLLAVWRKAALYDPERAAASAWIYAIARNLRIDRLRRDQRAKLFAIYETLETQDEPERPDGSLDTAQDEARVRTALSALPEEQVRVVQLSFFEGRAHGDIAKLLDLPLGTVKSRIRLAMNRLRDLLGEMT
ncbi:MAG TPA: sigma-70 family RNA polymerase sigma factor [Xanthobacteraceae bacterium]|nr:sigma-70 family RNA polymerase sigma factor [Xanthobacteraceae bacterium]